MSFWIPLGIWSGTSTRKKKRDKKNVVYNSDKKSTFSMGSKLKHINAFVLDLSGKIKNKPICVVLIQGHSAVWIGLIWSTLDM